MRERIAVIGGGVGGIVVANRLARRSERAEVVLVDSHGDHIYQPGLVYVPIGSRKTEGLIRGLCPLLHPRVELNVGRVVGVEPASRVVKLEEGEKVPYDFLVLATGSRVSPDRIPGFGEAALHFHCPRQATRLREAVSAFEGGDLVIGATRLPYKCPLSPVEMALLLDDHLSRDGRRKKTQIHFVYPLPRVGPTMAVADLVEPLLAERGIEIHTSFEVTSISPESREIQSAIGDRLRFDLLILVPPHTVAPFLKNSGLTGENGFVPTDPHSLEVRDGIYALGDNADLPAPKLGSAALYQAETVVQNLLAELNGKPPEAVYDGRSICFVETGRRRAAVVETAYDRSPDPKRPGRLNFLKKRIFNRLYFRMIARA